VDYPIKLVNDDYMVIIKQCSDKTQLNKSLKGWVGKGKGEKKTKENSQQSSQY
jgi:hypothetical protein